MYEEWNQNQQENSIYGYQQSSGNDSYTYNAGTYANDSTYRSMSGSVPPEKNKKPKKEKKFGFGRAVGYGLTFGLTASLVFCSVLYIGNKTFLKQETQTEANENTKEDKIENTITASTIPAVSKVEGELTVSQIVENTMPSIVSITNKSVQEVRSFFGSRQYESESCGSGIVIGQNDTELLIATNNHVVENANTLSVCFGDSEESVYEAQIKGTKADTDLAIVSVKMSDMDQDVLASVKIATLGNSEELKIGEGVVAIGNALGYGQSVTTGIVSALNREVSIENLSAELIQTDAAINPGNSGGALLNMKGELIGINSAKFASAEVEGMGYAIPIDLAQPILEELMMRETRDKREVSESGFLGISCQNVDSEVSEMYDIPKGVYVLGVSEGGAAQKAGLKKGDIITSFDGVTVTSRDELKNTLLYYSPGEEVELTIKRSNDGTYEEMKVKVTLDRNTADTEEEAEPEEEMQDGGSFYGNDMQDFFDQFYGNW